MVYNQVKVVMKGVTDMMFGGDGGVELEFKYEETTSTSILNTKNQITLPHT